MTTAVDEWVTVVTRVPPDQADLVAGRLWDAGVAGVEERACPGGDIELRAGTMSQTIDVVVAAVASHGVAVVERIEPDDGLDSWREYARAWRAGSRIVVVPSWQPCPGWVGDDDLAIRIDPGRAFGSGAHPTTRMCLTELEMLVDPDVAVADVGCGSGVLAVSAARLGASFVVAVDVDPEAVRATAENAERNGVADIVSGSGTPVDELEGGAYDLVVANMSSGTLVQLAPALTRAVADDGTIVLSGLLDRQKDDVLDAFGALGFGLNGTLAEEEWRTLLLVRTADTAGDPATAG
ncbi:MAG TPA: 50S ribosomal protein L11 methyltransferase [Acidimicrobiales bacterium]